MTATAQHAHEDDQHTDQEHAHPSQLSYIIIALILAGLTAIEVALSYIGWFDGHNGLLIVALAPLMIAKFVIVAAFFMHLRFDSHWFRRAFIAGIVLAFTVYFIVFAIFQFSSFQDGVHLRLGG